MQPGTEQRMADFTELVATAVGNAENRAELAASRTRIVATADEARRRIGRDLHDGAQQRLVALALRLRPVPTPVEYADIGIEIANVAAGVVAVIDDLQEISRGIHSAILSRAGLPMALRTLGRRSAIPVELDVRMLTNAAKHARATVVEVEAEAVDSMLRLCRTTASAAPTRGSGLGAVGLKDRIEALGGTFSVHSPPGGGTTVSCELPVR